MAALNFGKRKFSDEKRSARPHVETSLIQNFSKLMCTKIHWQSAEQEMNKELISR